MTDDNRPKPPSTGEALDSPTVEQALDAQTEELSDYELFDPDGLTPADPAPPAEGTPAAPPALPADADPTPAAEPLPAAADLFDDEAPTPAESRRGDGEQRRHPRRTLEARVDCIGREVLLNQPLVNISAGGLRLDPHDPEEPGQTVELLLHRPGQSTALALRGEVVWARCGAPGAMGLRFLALDRGKEAAIKRFLGSG